MLYISYQGIYDGKDFEYANTPNQIGKAFNNGFSCMVDVWRFDNKLYVGSVEAPIEVTEKYLQGNRFWINARNSDMLDWVSEQPTKLYPNYFAFANDTESNNATSSGGQIITPGNVPINNLSILFLPEIKDRGLLSAAKVRCYGICSVYLNFIKRMRNEGFWY